MPAGVLQPLFGTLSALRAAQIPGLRGAAVFRGPLSQLARSVAESSGEPRGRAPLADAVNLSLHGPVEAVVPIGGDLAPGRHTIRVKWLGGGSGGGWFRFYRFHDR